MNRFLSQLKLSQLIIGSLMVVGLVPLLALGAILMWFSQDALQTSAFNQLNSVRAIKSKQVETYFSEREGDLNVLANTIRSFHVQAVNHLKKDTAAKTQAISSLVSLFHKELGLFSASYDTKESLKAFKSSFVSGEDVKENARWRINSEVYGEHIRTFQQTFGWYDAFLISPDGDILYSAEQESDLGKNVNDEMLKNSGIAEAFRKASSDNSGEPKTYFGDFSYYEPSQDFAAFILAKVMNNDSLVGYVALQFPLQRVNELLGVNESSASDSYSYLVGQDKKLRSETAFLSVSDSHNNNQLLDTKSVQEGLSGRPGIGITRNSQNELALAQWLPVNVSEDTQWVFVNEMTIDTAVVPVDSKGTSFYSQYMAEYGYYDVFLVEPDGEIFYTETKEADYKTNILSGRYSNSNLGALISEVKRTGDFGLADFAPYEPSQGEPASFVARPIKDADGQTIYFVALQLSLDSINSMMQLREGMGQSGETYLVGEDYRMRSDSYLDASGHSVSASFAGSIENNGVRTEASELALSGKSGVREITDYNGNPVLSSYSPIEVGSTQWAVIAEIDSSEAFQTVSAIRQTTLIAVGVSLLATILLAVYLSGLIRKPLGGEPKEMMRLAEQIANGDLTHRFEDEAQSGSVYASLKDMSVNLKALIGQILESSQVLASTAEETSVASEQTTAAVAKQQTDTEMVATAVNQMTATVNDVAHNTENAALVSKEAHDKSEEGIAMLNSSMDSINTLVDDITSTAKDMDALVESTDQIDQVLTVIQTITEQTNLLALNAAIEAARAGEHGRGFAVVADEVRQLAQKTQASATDIQAIVSTVQNGAKASVSKMQKSVQQAESTSSVSLRTVEAFEEINRAIARIDDMMAQISTASEEQAHVSEDINQRILHISEVSIETAASSQQLSAASQEVARSAETLTEYTRKFTV
ncbi:methyl-accepting chemotaxis protein [Vibrio sp. JC009]|uniref:methyl-accepting chemotaxis protein n=1 Tax=Vibrio sp. JC009 TaxID=2912314 RepID=UPI0023AF500D|nr:methyl-accepting chemotaxis protein [Vibrio sp. JC009]WED24639.1 methyl-accepting chemotaxis protein [Vibrio sp. JC009]